MQILVMHKANQLVVKKNVFWLILKEKNKHIIFIGQLIVHSISQPGKRRRNNVKTTSEDDVESMSKKV